VSFLPTIHMRSRNPSGWGRVPKGSVRQPPARVIPVFDTVEGELAWQIAQDRQAHLQNRYSLGAPTVGVNVMRSAVPKLRAGSWVVLDLSWFPDYVTQRRGLVALGQVVALGDLDCAWRHLLVEQVTPIEPES